MTKNSRLINDSHWFTRFKYVSLRTALPFSIDTHSFLSTLYAKSPCDRTFLEYLHDQLRIATVFSFVFQLLRGVMRTHPRDQMQEGAYAHAQCGNRDLALKCVHVTRTRNFITHTVTNKRLE